MPFNLAKDAFTEIVHLSAGDKVSILLAVLIVKYEKKVSIQERLALWLKKLKTSQ